ncbi:acetyltransferase-like isoleucine patch superfamily enzyme [Rhodoblastus acidophilus]|uniref:acyltransferase n=1 Tax=Rhodoblastus acidophilus TaxID=1074 RepID=UPI00222443AA|nr:acyltransferase [Rhodoblastus acidophilus]MCW2286568.1 acetyltransferase-like isoleucine patch superfamily enzyme [Rhodoblastus acidophilus]MCW2335417.1 acetyltransferase-like isoleucine patch superfamily enzyme [Rhodoblastus acidophilus]
MDLSPGGKLSSENPEECLKRIRAFIRVLAMRKKHSFNRRVSIGDLLTERADNAAACGFGEGTTMYDNVLVLGDVRVGRHCWIGPGCILDGSGHGLEIGDWCSISAGVQIYTHNAVNRSTSLGRLPVDYAPTKIGDGVYIGPNAIVQMGVTIGDKAIIGAHALVNRNVPAGAKAYGAPARLVAMDLSAPSSPAPPDPTAASSDRTGRSAPGS